VAKMRGILAGSGTASALTAGEGLRAVQSGSSSMAAAREDRFDLSAFLCLVAPLVFLAGLVYHFQIESRAFSKLLAVSVAGFAVNYILPLRFRPAFFLALSLFTLAYLLDARHAAWIVGTGLALLAICELPIRFAWRIALLVAAGTSLAALRAGWATGPWPAEMLPILSSMFMFRLVIYLYDRRHTPDLGSPVQTLSYFFLLPNACFPLFPVVDYRAFCRGYYDQDRHVIHHVGVVWIFRGVLQLLLYRVAYQILVSDPASVSNVAELWQYFTWPFLLYLRVSGQFHIIIGILRLFGFNLPETHHSYFLASSFTDFWRRINIYWKDFMMKVFYYPSYFALRKRGNTFALVTSTLVVFGVTWALHVYQWFWLRGTVLLAWHDVLFWAILAICVVFNSLHEVSHGRQRMLEKRALTWRDSAVRALKTVAMFCFISVLWSLWSTESLTTWLSLWSAAGEWPDAPLSWAAIISLAVPVLVGVAAFASGRSWTGTMAPRYERTAAVVMATATALVLVSTSRVYSHLGPVGTFVAGIRYGGLNQADVAGLERGYYENLIGADRLNGDLWALYMNQPLDWRRSLVEAGVARSLDGFLPYELLPSAEGRFKGVPLRTNRWGMHDKEYAKAPAAGCVRIAVLGASHAMGSGVEQQDTFEAALENRLNDGRDGFSGCFEILNFAVYGYTPLHQLQVLEGRVAEFAPHAILYVGHPDDSRRVAHFLAGAAHSGKPLPYDELNAVIRRAGVDPTASEREIEQRLTPYGAEVLSWLYGRLVQASRQRQVCPAFVFMPMVPQLAYEAGGVELRLAGQAGFVPLDLMDVYDGADRSTLWVAEWDAHPNARAHRMMADRLYDLLRQDRSAITCGR
jgi:D-alanyl-lipoteichoic acid acyltransferase DltB (MBOAT superfamily)